MLVRKSLPKNLGGALDVACLQRRDRYRLRPPFLTTPFFELRCPLTASLSERPATNAATLRAGMLIASPESGLRPSRARR
jgi:hypothetical protein